jgi:hypothetical protein
MHQRIKSLSVNGLKGLDLNPFIFTDIYEHVRISSIVSYDRMSPLDKAGEQFEGELVGAGASFGGRNGPETECGNSHDLVIEVLNKIS